MLVCYNRKEPKPHRRQERSTLTLRKASSWLRWWSSMTSRRRAVKVQSRCVLMWVKLLRCLGQYLNFFFFTLFTGSWQIQATGQELRRRRWRHHLFQIQYTECTKKETIRWRCNERINWQYSLFGPQRASLNAGFHTSLPGFKIHLVVGQKPFCPLVSRINAKCKLYSWTKLFNTMNHLISMVP